MHTINFRKLLPYFTAIALFVSITLVYFNPLFEGKKIKQSDIDHFKGMSKEIFDYRAKTGKEPLWTNSMFGGMPAYQISVIYKGNLLRFVDKVFTLGLPHPANLVFLYMLGFFFLLLILGVDVWLSIAGSVAFAFSSYFFLIIGAGHNSKAHAIGYLAPVLASVILTYRGKYLLGGILSALFIGLELYTNHLQITYYLILIVFTYAVAVFIAAIKEKTLRQFFIASAVLVVASLLAASTNITSLWATNEYGKYTIRGKTELTTEKENRTSGLDKDYATDWSYGRMETFTLLIPNFNGGSSGGKLSENSASYKAMISNGVPESQAKQVIQAMPLYWGPQLLGTAGPTYAGAVVMFLFVLGLFIVDPKYRWWLLGATLLSILLAWGKNFMPFTNFFLEHVPGYNKFRAVSMTLVIAEFTIPLLAFLTVRKIINGDIPQKDAIRKVYYSAGITAGIALFFALFGGSLFDFSSPADTQYKNYFPDYLMTALREDRISLLRADAFRSFVFIVLATVLVWAFLKKYVKPPYFYAVLILLVLGDMWTINRRYLNNDDFVRKSLVNNPFTPTVADDIIMKDKDPNFRVFNQTVSPFNDASTSYFHKSIGGYHGAKLRRYQEMIEHHLSKGNMKVFNMLNTKYFIARSGDRNSPPQVQINMDALGNAWFVNDVLMVKNADEEINALDTFNPVETAVVDNRFESFVKGIDIAKDTAATIQLSSYAPNYLVYESNTFKKQLAVFSEIYYDKGWNAFIDGNPAPHFRVNYILRAMIVPEGKHKIEFKFEPQVFGIGEKVSFAGSALVILLVLGIFGTLIRKEFFGPKPEVKKVKSGDKTK